MGLSEIKRRILLKQAKEKKKLELMFKELEGIVEKIKGLKKDVERFQKRWGRYLSKQPELINLLSYELLGIKGFESDLEMKISLDILEIGREKNLTLIPLNELATMIREKNVGLPITLKHIEKAVKYLEKKKLIKGLMEINEVKYVQIKDFDTDIEVILKTFKDKDTLTVAEVVEKLGWSIKRAQKTLEEMVKMGLAVKEDYPPIYHLVKMSD